MSASSLGFEPHPYGVAAHAVYAASAGSGKTHQLTNRYLRLLLAAVRAGTAPDNPFLPARVLATTFTRKAAGEIRARVVARLLDAPKLAKEIEQVREGDLSPAHLRPEEAAAMLRLLARQMHRLRIGTMDAFLGALAQAHAPELGLFGEAMVIEEDAPLAAQVRETALEAALESLGEKLGEETLRVAYEGFHGGDLAGSVFRTLSSAIRDLHGWYRENPQADWSLPPAWNKGRRMEDGAIARAKAQLRQWALDHCANKRLAKVLGEDAAWVGSVAWEKEAAQAQTGLFKAALADGSYYGKMLPEEVGTLYWQLHKHAVAVEFDRLDTLAKARRAFVMAYDAGEESVRRQWGVSYYADAVEQLRRRLRESPLFTPALYERLDGAIDHLLFDEFQDTSRAQWQVFAPLALELSSGSERERSVLVVGDAKQAIYGWRGGCVDIFNAQCQAAQEVLDLSLSFRSSQAVLDAVNRVFGGICDNAALAHDQLDGAAIRAAWASFPAHRAAKDLPGRVEWVGLPMAPGASGGDGEEGDSEGGADPYADAVAAQIIAALSAHAFDSAGVLVRGNVMGQRLLSALRARHGELAGWQVVGEQGRLVADEPAAAACLACLRLMEAPDDTAAAAQVAASPLGPALGMPAQVWLDGAALGREGLRVGALLADLRGEVGLSETLLRLRQKAEKERAFGARDGAALDCLLALAVQFENDDQLRAPGAGRFLDFVANRAMPGGGGAAGARTLRVMTLHKSKGLEFDAVFMPDLSGQLQGQVAKAKAWVDRGADPVDPPRRVLPRLAENQAKSFGEEAEALGRAAFSAQVQESLCLLYVGMTRTRRFLSLLAPSESVKGQKKFSAAQVLRAAFGPEEGQAAPAAADQAQVRVVAAHGELAGPGSAGLQTGPGSAAVHSGVGELVLHDAGLKTGTPRAALKSSAPRITFGSKAQKRGFVFTSPSGGVHVPAPASAALSAADAEVASRRAKALGSLVHACFERIGFADEGAAMAKEEVLALAQAQGAEAVVAHAAVRVVQEALAHPAFAGVLSRRGASRVLVEQPLAGRDGEGRPVYGIADRIALWEEGGRVVRAEILDFKTDQDVPGGDIPALAKERHGAQLAAYRALLAQALKVDEAQVTAAVLWLRAGAVVWM